MKHFTSLLQKINLKLDLPRTWRIYIRFTEQMDAVAHTFSTETPEGSIRLNQE